ncbi:Retrovirus-related Pol polyprotein from transposon TNT 1-94 [Gossypium australe]|uniref:Retrovirus-related Pol polyprotein from transposon TNT 1-94 n=1 Tax=Gossypium australe TaxID=47621 RepID=A0A5B6WF41_9ROSI|nr:Retrovirus-related Pol polyprotein from transposon TNT 1-94 [Gossypium australe]
MIERLTNRKIIGVKWVFKTKLNPDGLMNKYKARLVVKGYAQVMDTIRMLLAMSAQQDWRVFQLDVKSAFLNGVLEEEIYVEQPEGFITPGQEGKVLYGLKQVLRVYYNKIDEHLLNLGFVKSLSESTLYVKKSSTVLIIISLYVDDMLVTGNDATQIEVFKKDMMEVFEMTDLGEMHYFLGMEIKQIQNEKKYMKEILKRFHIEECNSVITPINQKEKLQKMNGANPADERVYRSLMCLTSTRLDIMYIVSVLSRFIHCASVIHMIAAKRVLRYLNGTLAYGINFSKVEKFKLQGYSDIGWVGSLDNMRSISGYCFTFGSGCFSWCSRM